MNVDKQRLPEWRFILPNLPADKPLVRGQMTIRKSNLPSAFR